MEDFMVRILNGILIGLYKDSFSACGFPVLLIIILYYPNNIYSFYTIATIVYMQ